jgi:hypothetical protein
VWSLNLMTDQTAPVTPFEREECGECGQTESEGHALSCPSRSPAPETPRTNCFNCGTPYGGVHPSHKRLVRDGVIEPCIEREAAGSTDALRMDDDHEPHPCCRHPRCCPHALAASDAGPRPTDAQMQEIVDAAFPIYIRARFSEALHRILGAASNAGPATRSYIGRVRDTEERLISESLRTDAGPAGIDVDRLAEFFHDEYWAEANEPHWPREQADATDCEVCWSSAAKLHARLSHESDR